MIKSKGNVPIIIIFRIVVGVVGLFYLLSGMGNIGKATEASVSEVGENNIPTGFDVFTNRFSTGTLGLIKIIVGLALLLLCVFPQGFGMIIHAVFRI